MTAQLIAKYWSQGMDTYDIARFLGLPEAYVYNVLASRSLKNKTK
jgi:DNA-binding CsgD family transcriptional regulator